jgi:hypothetical protein
VWNRRLRYEVASLFVDAMKKIVLKDDRVSYEWLAYIPQAMNGFWQPLKDIIYQELLPRYLFHSREGFLHKASHVRILPSSFCHREEPLLPSSNSSGSWYFLSDEYSPSYNPTLKSL